MNIEAMNQALGALRTHAAPHPMVFRAMDALRLAIEQAEQPVAWMWADGTITTDPDRADGTWTPLYAAPRQWQGLTDEEILKAVGWETAEMYMKLTPNFPVEEARKETVKNARAIEAKLKEKNG